MNKDTALRLALEALEDTVNGCICRNCINQVKTITAIKAALEAKDEPVVWNEGVPAMLPKQKEGETFIVSYEPKLEAKDEPVQEPWESEMRNELVALGFDGQCPESIGITLKRWRDGYAAAQRKPLTDEEIQDALEVEFLGSDLKRNWQDDLRVAQAIEAAHGIKG
jgi:hypothetical protein